ncbi:UNVERIFIED_ORG: organic hydroperoxide reductase OsmC/OhrA [Pseudomonas mohnii]|jgi:organic hydroperoxide reductase OsmC/OhrA|nr:organic hydroperoxide reductase OsmC/OhrA [Pseudomonas mohnii]
MILPVRLDVSVPGLDQEVKPQLIDAAHQICPSSRMTRGDVEVQVKFVQGRTGH